MSSMKATYLLQQENKIYYGWLGGAVPHSDLNQVPQFMFEYCTCSCFSGADCRVINKNNKAFNISKNLMASKTYKNIRGD